tara:strand:- start:1198 stop:2841 length:1644 start_codon:yes stop_codon:yes gene_type:complete
MQNNDEFKFFTNYGLVLSCLSENPADTVRNIALKVGITERTAYKTIDALVMKGYINKTKSGRNNKYCLADELPLNVENTTGLFVSNFLSILDSGNNDFIEKSNIDGSSVQEDTNQPQALINNSEIPGHSEAHMYLDRMDSIDIDKDSKNAKIYFAAANHYSGINKDKLAIEYYSKILESNPKVIAVLNNRGNLYSCLGELQKAISDYDKAIEVSAFCSIAYLNRAIVHQKSCDYKNAINDYLKAIEIEEDDWNKATLYLNLGYARKLSGEREKAIENYSEAIRLNPKYAQAYLERGNTLLADKCYKESIDDFTQAINSSHKLKEAYHMRGYAYSLINCEEDALFDYLQAFELDMENERYKEDFVSILKTTGKYFENIDLELQVYSYIINNDPKDLAAYRNKAYLYGKIGAHNKKIRCLTFVIENDHEDAWSFYSRGIALSALEKYDQAISDYNTAIILDPDCPAAYGDRGIAFGYMGEYQKSLDDLTKQASLEPENKYAYYNRARTHQALNNYQAALDDYDRAIDIDASFNLAIKARKDLVESDYVR